MPPLNTNSPQSVDKPSQAHGQTPNYLYAPGKIRLLVIDDDAAIGSMIRLVFSAQDFAIEVVSDPRQVEKVISAASYNLILLDYHLPGLDSKQVMDSVRMHQPEASIIVITGNPSFDNAVHCLRAHIDDLLTKPFNVEQLRRTVLRCLEHRGLMRLSEDALREQLGAAIRERRKALDLTLADMAERTGVSLGYLSQIELGKNSASIETLYRIALGLHVRLAELFDAIQSKTK